MQRRAAAAYLVFFLILAASAVAVLTVAEEPGIDIDGMTYGTGDVVGVGDRTYTVGQLKATTSGGGAHGGGGGETTLSGTLTWTNESARHTGTLENNTTVPASDVRWDGQTARHVATIRAGDRVRFEGHLHRVNVTGNTSFALELDPNNTTSFETGDSLLYRNDTTTVAAVTSPAVRLVWTVEAARRSALLFEGETVAFMGEDRSVRVTGDDSFRLVRGNNSTTLGIGDTLRYRNNTTTVGGIRRGSATLTWGTYRVLIPNETTVTDNGTEVSDPDSFTFLEEPNVTALLVSDPAVYDRTVVVEDTPSIVYRENNTTVPVVSYLPEPERRTFTEGDRFTYRGTEVTVDNVTLDEVPLEWFAPREHEIALEEGANITLNGRAYVVHFVDEHEVLLSRDRAGYQRALDRRDYFHERMNGLKGVAMLSGLTALLIVGLAYLPVRG